MLLMLPLHMPLLVEHGIPPYVHQSVRPWRSAHEEATEIETSAVLWYEDVDAVRVAIAGRGERLGVEVVDIFRRIDIGRGPVRRVGDVEWVVVVDVSVGALGEVVEDVRLERVGPLHYECVEVEPPKPGPN